MIFKAKYDKGVVVMFLIMPVLMLLVWRNMEIELAEVVWLLVVSYVLVIGLIVMLVSIKYILTEDELIISKIGIKTRVPYRKIDNIIHKMGRYTMSAPSKEQLQLMHRNEVLIAISPRKMQEFEKELEKYLKGTKDYEELF